MAELDDFIMQQVGPVLRPGEQIVGLGWMRWPWEFNVLGVPQRYEEYLAASTNQRLVLLRTEAAATMTLLTEKVKPLSKEVVIWEYSEVAQVGLGQVEGMSVGARFLTLVPHEPLGPYEGQSRRYDVYPTVRDLAGQTELHGRFPDWLRQQVAGGAFPMDAAAQAKIAAHHQRLAAQREAAEARRQKVTAFLKRNALYMVAVVVMLAAFGSAFASWNHYSLIALMERLGPPSYSESTSERVKRQDAADRARELAERRTGVVVWAVVSAVLVAGSVALFVVAAKRRRAAATSGHQQPQAPYHHPGITG